ncbi:MAG TPA: hypothetical protein VM866_04600 [Pyrinomonadaceae bacterium]|nr:hypothetical protein [Pyrinomonadaceae bacterium]
MSCAPPKSQPSFTTNRTTFADNLRGSPSSLTFQHFHRRLACKLIGHQVSHLFSATKAEGRSCACGVSFLAENKTETRVRHHVSCFLGGHSYIKMCERDGHCEYVCVQCGHPLLFAARTSAYARKETFRKKVRYLCNLFGHRVHRVAERGGFTEYACDCGHSFLKRRQIKGKITHPLVCLFAGHFIRFVTRRAGYSEYLCRNCGHTFCFI